MKLNFKTKKKFFSIIQILFLFLLTISIAGYFSRLGADHLHDGCMLKPAFDMAHGQMLFRDTFIQYGALTTILQSWALLFFGNYLIVIKLLTVFFYGLIVVMLWLIWSLFLPEILTTIVCIIWILLAPYYDPNIIFLPWSTVYALFFQLVTLYSLLQFIQVKKGSWQIIAGIAAALTFWSRQPVGIFMLGSLIFCYGVLWLKRHKVSLVMPFCISYLITHGVFFTWIIANHALHDWWQQTIYFPYLWVGSFSQGKFMNFVGNIFPASYPVYLWVFPVYLWVFLPLIILYLGFIQIKVKKINSKQARLLIVVGISLASWLQYFPMPCPRHLYWAATPMIGFVFYTVMKITSDKKRRLLFLMICFFLFVPDILYRLRLAYKKISQIRSSVILTKPTILKGMMVSQTEKKLYDEAVVAIEQYEKDNPQSFIISTSNDALYTMFDGKSKNCYNLTLNWDWGKYDRQMGENYFEITKKCIQKYKPLVFTQKGYYHPAGYIRATYGTGESFNYLLLPNK